MLSFLMSEDFSCYQIGIKDFSEGHQNNSKAASNQQEESLVMA